jgi:hypothetical protein
LSKAQNTLPFAMSVAHAKKGTGFLEIGDVFKTER